MTVRQMIDGVNMNLHMINFKCNYFLLRAFKWEAKDCQLERENKHLKDLSAVFLHL